MGVCRGCEYWLYDEATKGRRLSLRGSVRVGLGRSILCHTCFHYSRGPCYLIGLTSAKATARSWPPMELEKRSEVLYAFSQVHNKILLESEWAR